MRQTIAAIAAAQAGSALSRADAARVVLALSWGSHPLLQEQTLGVDAEGGLHLRQCARQQARTREDLVAAWTSRCSCMARLGEMREQVEGEALGAALQQPGVLRYEHASWERAREQLRHTSVVRSAVLGGVQGPESSSGELRGRIVTALSHRGGVGEDSVRRFVQAQPAGELCAALGSSCCSGPGAESAVALRSGELSHVRADTTGVLGLMGCTIAAQVESTSLLRGRRCAIEVVAASVGQQSISVQAEVAGQAEVACALLVAGMGLLDAWHAAGDAVRVLEGDGQTAPEVSWVMRAGRRGAGTVEHSSVPLPAHPKV